MNEFKIGQRVKVEFEGVIADHPIRVQGHDVAVKRDSGFTHSVRPEDITLADPKDWPPQVGDIWEAEGREYFCRQSTLSTGPKSALLSDDGRYTLYEDEFKALNPVLVRRRGQ